MRLTLEIVLKTLLDRDTVDAHEAVGATFSKVLAGLVDSITSTVPLPPLLPTPANLRR
jgi:hypothetical protein